MALSSLNPYFKGLVAKRRYGTCDAIEPIGGAHYGTLTELTYRFEGVPESLIGTTGTQECQDVSGTTYNVNFNVEFTYDNTHLDYPHLSHSNSVSVTRRSPHLFDIEIVQVDHS